MLKSSEMIPFDKKIEIGDRFQYGKHGVAEVGDLVKTFSTARNEWNEGFIYLAKMVTGFSTNTFDVSKTTIIRDRIK